MLIYVLRWWPSWISDRHKKTGPSNDHSWAVWFQRRRVLKHFSHRVQCYTKSCRSRHFEFHTRTKNRAIQWTFMYSLALIIFVVSEKKAFEHFPIGSNANQCPAVVAILNFRSAQKKQKLFNPYHGKISSYMQLQRRRFQKFMQIRKA